MTGTVFDIQRFCVHDGPGIRTTVFLKGCSLRCAWCHNPEGLSPAIELQYTKQLCIHCGRCASPPTLSDVKQCPTKALAQCGAEWEEDHLFEAVMADACFYGTDGGVTFSGGECLLQSEFVARMLKRVKAAHYTTAVDTAGCVPWRAFEQTIPYCDLYLYDIKLMDSARHRQYTGAGNEQILENLKSLCAAKKRVWIRIPVIPDVNDTEEEMRAIAAFIKPFQAVERVTLMPYHTLGKSKYETLGLTCPYETKRMIPPQTIQRLSACFEGRVIE